jgi:hypothetical protein
VGGSAVGVPRGAGAGRRCSDRGASGADGRAPAAVSGEGVERRARGPAREENRVAEPR